MLCSPRALFLGGVSALALLSGAAQAATFEFSFTGAMQSGTITQSGIYALSLGGARGGDAPDYGAIGGTGALVSGAI